MPGETPAWVVSGLCEVIGLDKETVEQMLLPELQGYTNETKLRMYLQEFLGSSPAAKAFTTRYVSYRFPSIASSSSASSAHVTSSVHPEKPSPSPRSTKGNNKAGNSRPPSNAPTPSGGRTPALPDDWSAHFGGSGKVYMKNRDADESAFLGVGFAKHASGSGAGSGSNTPAEGGRSGSNTPLQRHGGAVTIHQAPAVSKRVDQIGSNPSGSVSGGSAGGSGKKGDRIWDLPKSRAVKKLEGILGNLKSLQAGEGKVKVEEGREECFCQARNHPLSPYIPHCPACGLVLCNLHAPHLPCPSCHRTLHSPAQLSRLIHRIQSEIDDQLARELAERENEERRRLERLAAESGGGAFPVLAGGSASGSGANSPALQDQGRKVLTLGGSSGGKGKGKGKSTATLTTTYSKPASSTPTRAPTPPPVDIAPPPRISPLEPSRMEKDLAKVLKWREEQDRPWGDCKKVKKGEEWKYIESKVLVMVEEDRVGRRRKKKDAAEEKGSGMDGRKVVGAA